MKFILFFGLNINDNLISSINLDLGHISKLLNYAYIKGLNVMLSMENLDDKSYAIRLDKNEMKSIIYKIAIFIF